MSVMEQIRKLEEQKNALLAQAKQEALDTANKAIQALNELGFHFRLVEDGSTTRAPRPTGTRRTGIREEVLALIKASDGMARADVLKAMNAESKSDQQSISNALAALKKDGKLTAENGVYVATK